MLSEFELQLHHRFRNVIEIHNSKSEPKCIHISVKNKFKFITVESRSQHR